MLNLHNNWKKISNIKILYIYQKTHHFLKDGEQYFSLKSKEESLLNNYV